MCRSGGRWTAGALIGASPSPTTANSRGVHTPRAKAAAATGDERSHRPAPVFDARCRGAGALQERRALVDGDSIGIGGALGPGDLAWAPPDAAPLRGSTWIASRTALCLREGQPAAAGSGRTT